MMMQFSFGVGNEYDSDMNDEIIFKKCDSKIFLTPCILDADDITAPEKEAYKELEEVVKEELSTNYDFRFSIG